MVSPKKCSGFRPPTRKKRKKKSSSSSDYKPLSRCLKVNDNNVGSSGKSVPLLEHSNELCSTDQSKLCGNCSADEKVDDAFGRKVGDVAVRKAVTEGAETKKPWCQLLSEFPQGPIKRKVYQGFFHIQDSNTNSRSLVKIETTSSTATLNPTVEISGQHFMAGAGKDLPEHAMICVINLEEYQNSLALIERKGSREPVRFNGNALGWNTSGLLNSGDQIVSGQLGKYAYVSFPYGVGLGGLCKDSHGYFCKVSELCLDAPAVDAPDKLLANTLFEVVFNESRKSPFILFVKDADKVMGGNSELYSTFKSRLEKLPDNVITIGSHAHTDNHKEKCIKRHVMKIYYGLNFLAIVVIGAKTLLD
ncbi:hypothetical protein KY290_028961 [Solanum tuberosum]|uniref:ATP binding protein n=1 Tax=Solanum tuberosum TaxID=4113 RepID=A0ABQ7UJC5_SOLTU|nr:hypothetical protein KY290_028961 [Solanum tuberosum]